MNGKSEVYAVLVEILREKSRKNGKRHNILFFVFFCPMAALAKE